MALSRNQAAVLDVLATSGGELSGLDIAAIIGEIANSSVYAALSALQRDGMVDARWDFNQSHPRRMVRASAAGLAALQAAAERSSRSRKTAGLTARRDGVS